MKIIMLLKDKALNQPVILTVVAVKMGYLILKINNNIVLYRNFS